MSEEARARAARSPKSSLQTIAGALQPVNTGVAQSVVNRILDLVRTGMLRSGDRLPSERELIDILNISRPSLREAIRALSTLGVVETSHGGGAYVTDLKARTLLAPLDFFLSLSQSNLADVFESRRIVEIEIVRKAAVNATAGGRRRRSNGMLVAHEKVLTDPVGFRILDARFHAQLSEIAGNSVLERIAYGLYSMGLDIRRRATENVALIRRSLGEHTAIVRAIETGDSAAAAAAMAAHLDHIEASTRARDRRGRRRILAALEDNPTEAMLAQRLILPSPDRAIRSGLSTLDKGGIQCVTFHVVLSCRAPRRSASHRRLPQPALLPPTTRPRSASSARSRSRGSTMSRRAW